MNEWTDKPTVQGPHWAMLPSGAVTFADVQGIEHLRGAEENRHGDVKIVGHGHGFAIEDFAGFCKAELPAPPASLPRALVAIQVHNLALNTEEEYLDKAKES